MIESAWLVKAVGNAKKSALPNLLAGLLNEDEINDFIDAIEVSLLTIANGREVTPDQLREAIRFIVEPVATNHQLEWTTLADAIVGVIEVPLQVETGGRRSWRG